MADITKTIEILFQGTNKTGTAIKAVGRDLDELNFRVGTVAQPFANLTAGVFKLNAALGTLAVGGLAVAYNESTKFEASYIELQKVVGNNVDGLAAAKPSAIELSNAYGESSSSVLESTANFVQAGFEVEDAMKLTKSSMDLVIAGGLEAANSSEILVAALKGFDAPATEAARLVDILNEVSNNFATDVQELGTGMAALSPIAKTMGFSMEQTAGILTPVIEVFRSGDEAAVALKTGLLKLVDDSKPVQTALAKIGVSQRDSNGALRSGKDILHDVGVAFQGLAENEKLFVTQQLVGINQAARMVTVFDGLSKSTAVTETALKAAGSASLEVAARLKSSEVAINRWVEGFRNAAIAIGDKFRVAATDAISGMTEIWGAVADSVNAGDFDEVFEALDNFGRGLAETFRDIAKTIPEAMAGVDFSGLLNSLGGFGDSIGGLFDDVDFSKAEDVQRLTQKVLDTFEELVRFSSNVTGIFVSIANKVTDLIGTFNDLDDDVKSVFAKLAGFGSVVALVTAPIGILTTALSGVGSVIQIIAGKQIATLTASLIGPGGLSAALTTVQAHPLIAAGMAGVAIGTIWRKMVPEVDQAAQSVLGFVDKYTGLVGVEAEHQKVQTEGEAIQKRWTKLMADRAAATGEVQKKDLAYFKGIVVGAGDGVDSTEELRAKMAELGILVETPKKVKVDTTEAKQAFEVLDYWREGNEKTAGGWVSLKVPVDTTEVDKAKKKIEDAIPPEKRLKIETDLQIEKVKAHSKEVQTALEWSAKLEIADVEAQTERVKSIADNIKEMFKSTGDVIGSIFDSWDSDAGLSKKWALQDSLRAEQERRDKALKLQEDLTKAQIKNIEAKTKAIGDGDSVLKIEGSNVSPHIEAFMWEILAALQVRVTEVGRDALLLGA